MKIIAILFLVLGTSQACYAACSDELTAKVGSYEIFIGDAACSHPQQKLIVSKVDKLRRVTQETIYDFTSECTWTDSGFVCRADGTSILAGAKFKKGFVRGRSNGCDKKGWYEYRCVSGCKSPAVPKSFYVSPYEC